MADPTAEDLTDSIRDILKTADLDALSAKKVRKQLEEKFMLDLQTRKKEIDVILMQLLNEKDAAKNEKAGSSKDDSDDSDDGLHSDEKNEPVRKKAKKSRAASSSDDDERIARRMQQEETGRSSRGGKAKPKEKKPSAGKGGPRKGNSLYSQECVLSEELAKVMGTNRMARKDVVSAMWKIFKERGLQDPKNKQFVTCDEQLYPVFKQKRFKAFGMMKFLKNHIKDAKLVTEAKPAASSTPVVKAPAPPAQQPEAKETSPVTKSPSPSPSPSPPPPPSANNEESSNGKREGNDDEDGAAADDSGPSNAANENEDDDNGADSGGDSGDSGDSD